MKADVQGNNSNVTTEAYVEVASTKPGNTKDCWPLVPVGRGKERFYSDCQREKDPTDTSILHI